MNNITKNEYKKALKEGRIFVSGCSYTKNGWTGFRVWLWDKKNKNLKQVIVKNSPHWRETKGFYHCTGWGTDRTLRVILSIGYALSLKFDEIEQNYHWLSF